MYILYRIHTLYRYTWTDINTELDIDIHCQGSNPTISFKVRLHALPKLPSLYNGTMVMMILRGLKMKIFGV